MQDLPSFISEALKGMNKDFTPYSVYCDAGDYLSCFFKDEDYYCQPLNENVELYISFDTKEAVGVKLLNVKQLMN